MIKNIFLFFALFFNIAIVSAQSPVMPVVGAGDYYYIRFKNLGFVIQDMGISQKILTKYLVPGTSAQMWRIDFGATPGTYILTSALGNKIKYNSALSRYTTETSSSEISFVVSTNSTFTNSYEIGQNGNSQRMNQYGGAAVDHEIVDWSSDDGCPLEFLAAPLKSDATTTNYYYLHFKNGNGVIQDMGDATNVLTKSSQISSDQSWKLVTDVTNGFYKITSASGRSLFYNGTNYQASSTSYTPLTFVGTANTTYHNGYEIGRNGMPNKMNQTGGSGFDKNIGEYSIADSGNPLEFIPVPKVSSGTSEWYFIKTQRGPTSTALWSTGRADKAYVSQAELTGSDYQIWKIVTNGSGFALQNKADNSYLNADAVSVINTVASLPTKALTFTISSYWSGAFMINGSFFNMHAGGSNNSWKLLNYNGGADNCSFQLIGIPTAFSLLISDAISYYNNTASGTDPGQVSVPVKATFLSAINAAVAIMNNSSSTMNDKLTGISTLSTALATFRASTNPFKYSVIGGSTTWYKIKNVARTGFNYLKDNGVGTSAIGASNSSNNALLWKVVNIGSGNVNLISYLNNGHLTNQTTSGQSVLLTNTPQNRQIVSLEFAQFNINGGAYSLHLDASYNAVGWNAGVNSGSAWQFEETPTITSSKMEYSAQESIQIGFTSSFTTTDWIAIDTTSQGVPAVGKAFAFKCYCNSGTQTPGGSIVPNGSISIAPGVLGPGNYTIYYLAADGYTIKAQQNIRVCNLPTVSVTSTATSITYSTASSGGTISADNYSSVTVRGVCWSTSAGPTVALNTKTVETVAVTPPEFPNETGTNSSSFLSSITGLSPGTLYHVRAYATNAFGTGYGPEITFETPKTLEFSTSSKIVWYSIKTPGRTQKNYIGEAGLNTDLIGKDYKDGNDSLLWKIVDAGSGRVNIVSKLSGGYFTTPSAYYTPAQLVTTPSVFTLTYLDLQQYTITATNFQLHLQADSKFVRWSGGLNSASAWIFEKRQVEVKGDLVNSDILDCTSSDVTIRGNGRLTINAPTAIRNITVDPNGKIDIQSGLTVGNVTLKADDSGSFNARIGAVNAITGTVKYQRTINDAKWYFLSFPCDIPVSTISMVGGGTVGVDWAIQTYNGAKRARDGATNGTNWYFLSADSVLKAKRGYIFGLTTNNNSLKTLIFPLNKTVFESESQKSVPTVFYNGNKGENNKGWNLIGQPYLSAFSGSDVGIAYITTHNGSAYVGAARNEVAKIDPFEAFFVQVPSSMNIDFTITGRQNARSQVLTNSLEKLQININNQTDADNTQLIFGETQKTGYEIGQDLEKWIVTGTAKPQIYTVLDGINYAYNALPVATVQNLPLGYYSKSAGSVTINASQINIPLVSGVMLRDNLTGKVSDLLSSAYTFTTQAGTYNSRFALTIQRMVDNTEQTNVNEPVIRVSKAHVTIQDLSSETNLSVYDSTGRLILNANKLGTSFGFDLHNKGIYMIQLYSSTNKIVKKITIN